MRVTTALLTDRYELTMIEAALRSGRAHRPCVFEVFGRRLHGGRRFGVVAGTGRVLEAIADFHFGTAELDWLSDNAVVDEATLRYLADYRFTGSVHGYREGELYFPNSPLLTNAVGTLDASGAATAKWNVLPQLRQPPVQGFRFHHAYVVLGNSPFDFASNAVPLTVR